MAWQCVLTPEMCGSHYDLIDECVRAAPPHRFSASPRKFHPSGASSLICATMALLNFLSPSGGNGATHISDAQLVVVTLEQSIQQLLKIQI